MTISRVSVRLGVIVLAIVTLTLVVRLFILGGVPIVQLDKGSHIGGALSQGLITSSSGIQIEGKDYVILDTQYFDNKDWVIVTIKGTAKKNISAVILKRVDGNYRVALGPGTAFSDNSIFDLPLGLSVYLNNHGLIYGSE